ncbi:nitrilase-related carbon-nitrogen hydrolase [Patulibacter sp. S7RM1-6]
MRCHQLAPVVGELDHNRALALAAIRDGVADGADVIVLPELATSGYVFASADEAAGVAIPADDPLLEEWADAVRDAGAVVVGGFCERGADGRLHNSAALVDGSGVRAVYRKTHLWDREKLIFAPGDDAPPVVETAHGRIGVLVCYDLEFAELTRGVALAGADLLAVPTNWPLVPRPAGEHPPEVIIGMAAARTNRMFVACCDRAGVERGQEWTSGTAIVDHEGWVVAETTEEGAVTADLDLTLARDKRLTENAHLHGDRRPELYGSVAAVPDARRG